MRINYFLLMVETWELVVVVMLLVVVVVRARCAEAFVAANTIMIRGSSKRRIINVCQSEGFIVEDHTFRSLENQGKVSKFFKKNMANL